MPLAIEIRRGDDYVGARRITLTVTESDGTTRVDLTGTALTFMAKRRSTDANADAAISKAVGSGITLASPQSGGTKGQALLALAAADTEDLDAGRYHAELEGEDAIGKVTLATGYLRLLADLVRG